MIYLEPFTSKDFAQLQLWIKDEETLQNWAGSIFSFPLSDRALEWYIEDCNQPDAEAHHFNVVETETGKSVGHISLGSISEKNRAGRITRVFIAPEVRGKNYCYHMTKEVLRFGFEELKLHRIGLGVYTHNKSAIRCYEKAGFQSEGIQRDILWTGTEWWSMLEMSVLEEEWEG